VFYNAVCCAFNLDSGLDSPLLITIEIQ